VGIHSRSPQTFYNPHFILIINKLSPSLIEGIKVASMSDNCALRAIQGTESDFALHHGAATPNLKIQVISNIYPKRM
jgi:hypothetical protein